jgi:hypothetical protein
MKLASARFIVVRSLAVGLALIAAEASAPLVASDNPSADRAAEKTESAHFAAAQKAVDFRVESKVYEDKAANPSSESTTLFVFNDSGNKWHNLVYDFLSSPSEITIFETVGSRVERKDEHGGRNTAIGEETTITLLDRSRKVRSVTDGGKLWTFTQQLRSRAARQTSPLLKFAAEPNFGGKFERTGDDEAWVRFSSPWITYRVRLATDLAGSTNFSPYFDFCDYSAQLNSMMHPGALPPFPRMEVDSSLRSKSAQCPPNLVEVTISDDSRGAKPIVLHSEHHFSTQLTTEDRQRIDEANESLKTFKQVSWEEYLRPIQQAKR